MLKNLLFLILLFFSSSVQATHIVGGALSYEYLGGSSYRVKLKLYRDCDPSVPTFYANSYEIRVRSNNGTALIPNLDFTLPRIGITQLNPLIDTCAANPGICVQEAIFSDIINLPPNVNGYHLIFQTGDRNASIINLNDIDGTNPDDSGISLETFIPYLNGLPNNSSPTWSNFPPVFVCAGRDLNFDHSANDLDGDSLAYKFYQPWGNENFPTFPAGPGPNNILYETVPYEAGFTVVNPINLSGTPTTINQNGLISGIPENLGQYVLAVMCEEYRDGILIGRIVRDFQLNVVYCAPLKEAGIAPVTGCSNVPIQFTNISTAGANNFFWNFGDLTSAIDTISSPVFTNPNYTYPSLGNYTVTLIAQRGSVCADTTVYNLSISDVTANFTTTDSICIGSTIDLTDASVATNSTVTNLIWNFGSVTNYAGSTLTSPPFINSGTQNAQLIAINSNGCRDTLVKPIFVQALPLAFLGNDTMACLNNTSIEVLALTGSANGGVWLGNGGAFSPSTTNLNPLYSPTLSEYAAGQTSISFTTTGNGFCPGSSDTLNIMFVDAPSASVGQDLFVCNDTLSVPVSLSSNFSGGTFWFTPNGTGTFLNPSAVSTVYLPTLADITLGTIQLIGSNINNGNCTSVNDTLNLSFFSSPTASIILFADTICTGNVLDLVATSSTNDGIWTTVGDGVFNPTDTLTTAYTHGLNDAVGGIVTLIFSSTNNSGCKAAKDSLVLTILPSPNASFTTDTVCFGLPNLFANTSNSATPIVSYFWTFSGGATSTLENPSQILSLEGVQNVKLRVTSANGCTASVSVPIYVHYLPDVAFGTPAPCVSSITSYFDSTTVENASVTGWSWQFGNNTTSSLQNPQINYSVSDSSVTTLIATSSKGCKDTLSKTIFIFQGPTAKFTTDVSSANVFDFIQFTDQSTGLFPILDWQWNFGNGSLNVNQNPSYSFNAIGTYSVGLIVEDINGCSDTTSREIIIFMPPKVPGAFSPNDDSNNDILFVYGGLFETLEFKIFNNWGEIIFISQNQAEGWDGKFKNEIQPVGVYVYTVAATTRDGVQHKIQGDFSLII